MFDRENAVGFLLLGVCVAVGGVMVFAIATGTTFTYTGPAWLGWVLFAVFVGAIGYGIFSRRRSGGRVGQGPQWPDPGSGRRPWWRRLFGRDSGGY